MRFDLPHDLPRPRRNEAPPLTPSPLDVRRERLAKRAAENRGPQSPARRHEPAVKRARPREVRERSVSPDRPMDRRPQRHSLPSHAIGPSLRAEEIRVLSEVGRFRVIATRDLAENVYDGRRSRMERDLRFLRDQGLITVDAVNARRDGRGGKVEHLEVVTLTKAGRNLAHHNAGLPHDQKLYAGLVKPREVEHDAQIYRAFRKEAERIEQAGGQNLRVRLDFELKAQIQKAIYAARKADPKRDMNDIKRQTAAQFDLPFLNGGIQIPDARIEFDLEQKDDQDLDQGSRSGHADIEVLTAAYRPGHLRNKAQAGFHVYASASDRAALTARVEDEHHLLDRILEL
jgi:hypothetical protein